MPDDLLKRASSMWSGFRKKAADTVAGQEAAFARGKIAANDVLDNSGAVIVSAGHRIDDHMIEQAAACGKLHALAQSALTGKAQDVKENLQGKYARTDEGIEESA